MLPPMLLRVKWSLGVVCLFAAFAISTPATAVLIAIPGTVVVTVDGKSSVYGVEGLDGTTDNTSNPATSIEFVAAAGNEFEVLSVDGPNGGPSFSGTPSSTNGDGRLNTFTTSTLRFNGLSGITDTGNPFAYSGLLGVFIDSGNFNVVDPVNDPAPATLVFDVSNPTSLMPVLNQVFYIGDGRDGFDDQAGAALVFTAPDSANRLYLGFTDGLGSPPRQFNDNVGSLNSTVTLTNAGGMGPVAVPLPGTLALSAIGLCALGWSRRRRA